jgi:ankyrin repeat protein
MNKLDKLILACKNGNIEKVNKLIKPSFFGKGADVNGIGEDGYSPLLWALKNNNQELYQLLVSNGAEINAYARINDNGYIDNMAPLHFAVKMGNIELINLILSNGADINLGIKNKKNTPLFYAINKKNLETAKLLISKGADVNAKRGGEESLLSFSISINQKETTTLLISEGADVNIKNHKGNTPIMVALESISSMLERSGSGYFGSLAVEFAKKQIETIKFLILKGADPYIKNNKGESPHSLIQKLENSLPEISELYNVFNQIEKNKEITIENEIPNSVLNAFKSANGGSDLAKLIRTHSHKDIETFCKIYQFEDIKLDDGLSRDVNRFEGITILAEIIMEYERVRNEDPSANLPANFPHNQIKDILLKRIIDFVKTQSKINIAPIYRTRIYDFAMSLMRIKDYRNAIECLKVSKPSLKGDDEFWLAACYFNIANSGNNKNDISEAISVINKLIKSKPNLPNQALETLDKMYNILKEK